MIWWPFWQDRPWYDAVLWIAAAIVFGTWFGLQFGAWLSTQWDLNMHRRMWRPQQRRLSWWRRLLRWFGSSF